MRAHVAATTAVKTVMACYSWLGLTFMSLWLFHFPSLSLSHPASPHISYLSRLGLRAVAPYKSLERSERARRRGRTNGSETLTTLGAPAARPAERKSKGKECGKIDNEPKHRERFVAHSTARGLDFLWPIKLPLYVRTPTCHVLL